MDNIEKESFQFDLPKGTSSIIKVIGVGGGGNNALRHMYEKGIHGVDFVICNTDAQTLDNNPVANKVQLGTSLTEGLGAGADPEVGEKAAIESIDDIKSVLNDNTKMIFITAGMGGGTGTGAAPVIAKIAKEMGILTIAIVTIPFTFEGKRRLTQAEDGLMKLRDSVDSLIIIDNDKLREQFGNLGFKAGFAKADEVLTNAAKGMAEVITGYFDVNIDFRDAKSVLQNSGTALMSTGTASGENKAEEAIRKALDSPLLNDNKITGARNVLLLIRSGKEEITMDEIGTIMGHIQTEAGNTADIIFGVGTDEELGDAVSVLVIATGFKKGTKTFIGNHPMTNNTRYVLDGSSIPEEDKEKTDLFRMDDNDDEPAPEFPLNKNTSAHSSNRQGQFNFFENNNADAQNLPDIHLMEEDEQDQEFKTNFGFDTSADEEKQDVPFYFAVGEDRTQNSEIADPNETPVEEPVLKTKEEVDDEIKIIDKLPLDEANQKVQERRNKLKEFNSRFSKSDIKEEFERIPAFKRKNINVDLENASDQTIGSYLSQNKGKTELKENRFLNKDVD